MWIATSCSSSSSSFNSRQLYDAETEYLSSDSSQMGTLLKGYDGFLSSKDNLRKRARAFKIEDRLFSLSSRTSPAVSALFCFSFCVAELKLTLWVDFAGQGGGTCNR